MKNSSEKPKSQKNEKSDLEEEVDEEEFQVDDRVKFRVNKKLSKVLYINGGKKSSIKKQCENFAKILEEIVRNRSDDFSNYKKTIMRII